VGSNPGTYQSGSTLGQPGAIAGDSDTAARFNGTTGWVSVPSSSSLNVGDQFTIEAWVRRERTGRMEVIASKQNQGWVLDFNSKDQLTLRKSNVADVVSSTLTVTDTAWHYVAASKDGSAVHLYLDGRDVTGPIVNPETMVNNTRPLAIGQSSNSTYLQGTVDEVALYNAALTPTQIANHYAAGANHDPVVVAVGDIACAPGDTTNACKQQATAGLAAAQHPNAVLTLGDNQYNSGLLSEFTGAGGYGATWGQFNSIVHPDPGNHEYASNKSAAGYFSYFGSLAGPSSGNYSFNLGSWHLVSLNSDCDDSVCHNSVAGTTSSAEVSWLQSDLASNPSSCTLAYWHHPRFSAAWVGDSPGVGPLWNVLYSAHADLVLDGHDHLYERYAPQDPSGTATSAGIREFVVGTGGENLMSITNREPNLQFADQSDFGVLVLTLHPSSYDWAFKRTDGTVIDSGTTPCHGSVSGSLAANPMAGPLGPVGPGLKFNARVASAPLSAVARRGLGMAISLNRASNVNISVAARLGGSLTRIASFHEDESDIPRAHTMLWLRLPARLLNRQTLALVIHFVATDAAMAQRTLSQSITLRR
jgi:hypothetical protein